MNAETDSSHLAAPGSTRTSGDAAPNAPSAHTPGPWHWTWDGEGQPGRVGVVLPCEPVEHCGYDSHCIALTQPGKFDARANAERIVRCVNSHDELVDALRKFVDCDFTYFKGKVLGSNAGLTRDDVMRARAAIAKALGTQSGLNGSPARPGRGQMNNKELHD